VPPDWSVPRPLRVVRIRRETRDVVTLELTTASPFAFSPGQFNMLYAFGLGEVAISISGDPAAKDRVVHTVRAVGAVSGAITRLRRGMAVGVRGPYGSWWPIAEDEGSDIVIIAGGLGLAPLRPAILKTLATSTAISAHVPVDFELRGCPIDKGQLLEIIKAFLIGRKPAIPGHSVCHECKLRGTVCVVVAHGTPCLGPVTQTGCGAICPAHGRGCYGCFGPAESPNTAAIAREFSCLGMTERDIARVFRSFNAAAEAFRKESEAHGE